MKLYMKEDIFSKSDKYIIVDKDGSSQYYLFSEISSIGQKHYIFNNDNEQIARVNEKSLSLSGKYHIYLKNNYISTIKQKITQVEDDYFIPNLNWYIIGNIQSRNYSIICDNKKIAIINNNFAFNNNFEIDIITKQDKDLVIATIIAIECALTKNYSQLLLSRQVKLQPRSILNLF